MCPTCLVALMGTPDLSQNESAQVNYKHAAVFLAAIALAWLAVDRGLRKS